MKKISSIITALLLLFIAGCSDNNRPGSTSITVVFDITEAEFCDTLLYAKDIPIILKKTNIDTTTANYAGITIRYDLLSDLYSDKGITIRLDSAPSGFVDGVNEYDRIDEIKTFQQKAKSSVGSLFKGIECKKDKSKIYETLCRLLQKLTADNANRKVLIVYSDMLENSSLFSFYDKDADKRILEMIKHIGATEKQWSDSCGCSLPALSDIEIIVINRHNSQDDDKAELAERFWTILFQLNNVGKITFSSHLE
jgi:hypothetical protein